MRLGLLGPANGDLVTLARAAQVLLDQVAVERILYVGSDDALDVVIQSWAVDLVGENPSDERIFDRAAQACAMASPDVIDTFIASERARRRLSVMSSVPPPPGRTVEILDGRLVLFVFDKAALDEDDIAGASLLVFGKADASLFRRIGTRAFFSPGTLNKEGGGVAVIDDEGGTIRVDEIDLQGQLLKSETLERAPKKPGAKLRVQGEDGGNDA